MSNKRKLKQISFNHSLDIGFQDLMNLYKKSTVKPHFFFSSKKSFRKLILTIDDKIIDKKLQYVINKEAAKISALSSRKIDKYEFLKGEEILPSDRSRIIEQAKFTYFPLGKAF